ncbi:unnamed protein product [Dovyalis caffra]|uniref:RING-type E3 ubiquitin transferase n=1 Tax=Dovyalis caffra TaxID=77055 RepID=A0AAV1SAB5_9ROSI|nr:unnamed protein product [Dovyalis caffra]
MAMKHRKLFPAGTETNQTTDCPDFCDPACPYNCYPYSDYYLLPPPPPPPPPPSFLPQERHLSPYVIIIVALLASFFLIVSYYVIVAKSCCGWCGSRNNRQPQAQEENTDEEFLDENRVDHPIWFIATIGLQQSIINSITVFKYKKGEGLIEGSECSVCLSEFRQDETLRLLPKCNHAFHISCIDTWLRSHTNCPLCRAHIVNGGVSAPLVSVGQNHDDLNPIVSSQMENSHVDSGFSNIQERNEPCENRAVTDEGGEILQVGEEKTLKDEVNYNDNGDLQVLCDSVDKYQDVENNIKPMRRSSSMDSLKATTTSVGLTDHSPLESEENLVSQIENNEERISKIVLKGDGPHSSEFKLTGSSSISQCLHKGPVSMKRSFSCGGGFSLQGKTEA